MVDRKRKRRNREIDIARGKIAVYLGRMKNIDLAVHEAVCAIYLADNNDYLSALWSVVRNLAPELLEVLENEPAKAYRMSQAQVDSQSDPSSTKCKSVEKKLAAAILMLEHLQKYSLNGIMGFGEALERLKRRPCRPDGRCQYAIDLGAESEGCCPPGKCQMQCAPGLDPGSVVPVMISSEPASDEEIHEALKAHSLLVTRQSVADMRKALDGFISFRIAQ